MDINFGGVIFIWVAPFWPIIAAWLLVFKKSQQITNLPMYYVASAFMGFALLPLAGLILFLMESYAFIDIGKSWGTGVAIVIFFGLPTLAPLYFKKRYSLKNS